MILQDDIAKYFQSRAMECDRMARMAGSVAVADLYRKMEERWLGAALRVEAASRATAASVLMSSTSSVAMRATVTAAPITSAGRSSP